MALEITALTKRFTHDRPAAVDGVTLSVEAGEILAVVGPSGCGKSTLLALVAGLETPDAGEIRWQGRDLAELAVFRRGFGLMFQDYALFPHLDVAGNVGFGLKMRGKGESDVEAGVRWALELVGLDGFDHRDVNLLSGGEQQRVALARTLAPRSPLVLLDEPLGALDRLLREQLLEVIAAELRAGGQTAVYVTHDQEEAFAVADRVAVMRAGRIAQLGAPAAVYARPANRWVAEFLGFVNLLPASVEPGAEGGEALTPVGRFAVGVEELLSGTLLIRPEGARIVAEGGADISGTVLHLSFRGSRQVVDLDVAGTRLRFEFPAGVDVPGRGRSIHLALAQDATQMIAS